MAKFNQAVWRGPVPNMTPSGMVRPLMGLVLHIESGTETGTNAWFHNPKAQVSAHFGNPKLGQLDQFVDTNDKAWAEVSGNPRWISLENEGQSGDSLTPSQLENAAQLLAWLHTTEGIPLQVTDNVNTPGLGWHGMGASAWGGHLNCPGEPIKNQRSIIIQRAQQLVAPAPTPKGNSVMFNPSEPIVSLTTFFSKRLNQVCAVAVKSDGAILCAPGNAYEGGANGQAYFAGRTAAQVVDDGQGGYEIIATSNEKYSYPAGDHTV